MKNLQVGFLNHLNKTKMGYDMTDDDCIHIVSKYFYKLILVIYDYESTMAVFTKCSLSYHTALKRAILYILAGIKILYNIKPHKIVDSLKQS